MIDKERIICVCNDRSMGDIATCIKQKSIETMDDLVETCELGDKCESCIEEGYDNDGYSLAMVLSLVKQGRL